MEPDHDLARRLAWGAGQRLRTVRDEGTRLAPSELGDRGDRVAHEWLMAELAEQRPGDHVLSEHGTSSAHLGRADRTWIIDPLDGTKEFRTGERTDWAVHVALVEGTRLRCGAVALPARSLLLDSANPPAAPEPSQDAPRIAVSRSRPPSFLGRLVDELGAVQVPMGSAGAKISAVVLGAADAYVHAGGQHVWDSAAPVAVARAVGLHTSRVDGSELVYRPDDTWMPDLLVCRPDLSERLLHILAGIDLGAE